MNTPESAADAPNRLGALIDQLLNKGTDGEALP